MSCWGLVVLCASLVVGVPDIDQTQNFNPEVTAGLFEGDIELNGENPFGRNAVNQKSKVWPNGRIPYRISSYFNSGTRDTIVNAMQQIENDTRYNGRTCIDFVPRTNEHDYAEVVSGSGCHSPVGHQGGHQTCTIGEGCHRKGIIMHELLHTMGFWHEQSSPLRDQYVTIVWNNIASGQSHNFQKHTEADTLGVPYDYGSIMHYNAYEFSRGSGLPTIQTKQRGVYIGQRIRLSALDIKKIQILYGCLPRGSSYMPPTAAPVAVFSDSCTFQTSMCEWHNLGGTRDTWQRRKGKTPSGRTGPNYDHHLSYEGYYLYVEATNMERYTALLGSKMYNAGSYCITYYYHMLGNDQGTLTLRVSTGGRHTNLKSISRDQGDIWRMAQVHYTSQTSFQFQFLATIGTNYASDMALDDISIHTGTCTNPVIG